MTLQLAKRPVLTQNKLIDETLPVRPDVPVDNMKCEIIERTVIITKIYEVFYPQRVSAYTTYPLHYHNNYCNMFYIFIFLNR